MSETAVLPESDHILALSSVLLEVVTLLRGPLPDATRHYLEELNSRLLVEITDGF